MCGECDSGLLQTWESPWHSVGKANSQCDWMGHQEDNKCPCKEPKPNVKDQANEGLWAPGPGLRCMFYYYIGNY